MVTESGIKERLRHRIESNLDLSREPSDEDIGRIIDRCILQEAENTYIPLKEKLRLKIELFNSFRRLDVLTEYLEDEEITEIMVNGSSDIFIEKNGSIARAEKSFDSEDKLRSVIQQIVSDCNRRINEADPIVDARLADGSRVNIVMNPISLNGPIVTIRKFSKKIIDMNQLIALGSISSAAAKIMDAFVKAGYNIFISGGTDSGKTTFLNALSEFIPKDERIITIEDSAELQIRGIPNLIRLEARNVNVEGTNGVSIRALIKASLRMRPDRIIVGEVRDEAAIDMLAAMNTGHDGSISTGHANSAEDMLSRLESMVLMGMEIPLAAVRRQIMSAVDIIIHLGKLRDRSRHVLKICEVEGMEHGEIKLNTLFEFAELREEQGRIAGVLRKVNDLVNTTKLIRSGTFELYEEACSELQCV